MRKVSLLSLTIFGVLALSCTSRDDFQQPKVLDSVFSIDALDFDPLGESFTLTYSADVNWRINFPSEWLDVTPASGNPGTYEITVSARVNNSWARRSGSIVVDEHQISVTQDCPYLRLSYSDPQDETLDVSEVPVPTVSNPVGDAQAHFAWNHSSAAGKAPLAVRIESNIAWEMVLDEGIEDTFFKSDDHQEAGSFSYSGDRSFNLLSLKNNYRKEDCLSLVTIRPVGQHDLSQSVMESAVGTYHIQMLQDHLIFLVNEEADDVTVNFDELGYLLEGGSIRADSTFVSKLNVLCEIPWQVEMLHTDLTPYGDGFVSSNVSGGSADKEEEVRLQIPNRYNPEEQEREMIVRLSAADGEAFRDIFVHQDPYIFQIDGLGNADTVFDNGEISTNGTTAHEITLRTTGSWSVSVPSPGSSWLSVDPATSRGSSTPGNPKEYTIRFWAKTQNLDLVKQALANLDFVAVNGIDKAVPVAQDPFLLQIECDADQLANLSATRTSERFPMYITASNAWRLVDENKSALTTSDWYAVSTTQSSSASNRQTVQVGAAEVNDDDSNSRTKVILLVSDVHEAMSSSEQKSYGYAPVKVTLKQRPFTFRINGKVSGQSNSMVIPAYKKAFTDAIRIECDGEWEVVNYPSWIHPNSTSGTVDENLVLNPDINLEETARSAGTIRVNCLWDGTVRNYIDVTVSQQGIVFKVTRQDSKSITDIDPDVNFETHKPLSYSFSVEATDELPWVLESSNTAFIASSGARTGNGTVTVSPTYNSSLSSGRNSTVDITLNSSADGRISSQYVNSYRDKYKWTFTQKEYKFDTSTPSTVVFKSQKKLKSGNKDISFDCSGPWTVESPSWVHTRLNGSDVASGESNPKFEISVDENPNQTVRGVEYVIVRSRIGGHVKQIPVQQDKYYYGLSSASSLEFKTVDAEQKEISFYSSGSWTLDGLSGWGADKTSGEGDDDGKLITVKVKPADYLELNKDHESTVTLRSGSYASETIKLKQPKYIFSQDKSQVSFTSPFKKDCADQSVNVNCTGDWTATSNQSWLKVNNGSKSGNGAFSLTVTQDNLTTNLLSATVTITTTYKGKTVSSTTIPVSQSAYEFTLSKTSHEFDKNGGSASITVNASGSWAVTKVKDEDGMIADFTASGSKTGTITIKANTNTGKNAKDKTATLEVKCEKSDNLVKTITLTQKK